jgi:hypothetical protein
MEPSEIPYVFLDRQENKNTDPETTNLHQQVKKGRLSEKPDMVEFVSCMAFVLSFANDPGGRPGRHFIGRNIPVYKGPRRNNGLTANGDTRHNGGSISSSSAIEYFFLRFTGAILSMVPQQFIPTQWCWVVLS